jgi:hypothetical protein
LSENEHSASAASTMLAVSGNPTAEELAALVVVLSALGGDEESDSGRRRSAWADPAWRLVGPSTRIGGWRASALPR